MSETDLISKYQNAKKLLEKHVGFTMVELSKTNDELKNMVGKIELICQDEEVFLPPELKETKGIILNLIDKYHLAARKALDERYHQIKEGKI